MDIHIVVVRVWTLEHQLPTIRCLGLDKPVHVGKSRWEFQADTTTVCPRWLGKDMASPPNFAPHSEKQDASSMAYLKMRMIVTISTYASLWWRPPVWPTSSRQTAALCLFMHVWIAAIPTLPVAFSRFMAIGCWAQRAPNLGLGGGFVEICLG